MSEGYKLSIIDKRQCLKMPILCADFIFYVQVSYSMYSFRVRECTSMRFEVRRNLDFATVRTKLPTVLDGFATKKYWFPAAIWTMRSMPNDVREQTDQHEVRMFSKDATSLALH